MKITTRIKMPEKLSPRLYIGLFFASFLVFLLVGFPRDAVEKRIIFEIQSKSPVPVLIGGAGLRGISSVELRDMRVVVGDGGSLLVDRARVGAGLFSVAFSDEARISFSADAYGGKIDGTFSQNMKKKSLTEGELSISSVESSPVSRIFLGESGVAVTGKVDASVKFLGDGEGGGISKMEYLISSPSFSIAADNVRGFDIGEKYENLSVVLRGTANRFESRVEKFSVTGPQMSLQAEGKAPSPLRLRKGAALDLSVTFRPPPKDVKLALAGSFLGSSKDGTFSGRIQGTLAEPRIAKPDGG